MNAFVAAIPGGAALGASGTTFTSRTLSRQQMHARVPPRARARRRATLSLSADTKSESASEPAEEEVLDEKAMRAAEIHEVLVGLEDFKMRIVEDATKLAKKVRAPKKQLEASLATHPDILKINGHIAELQEELKQLGDR